MDRIIIDAIADLIESACTTTTIDADNMMVDTTEATYTYSSPAAFQADLIDTAIAILKSLRRDIEQ